MPRVLKDYHDLYMMSMRARYRAGFRAEDSHRSGALTLLTQLERALSFA